MPNPREGTADQHPQNTADEQEHPLRRPRAVQGKCRPNHLQHSHKPKHVWHYARGDERGAGWAGRRLLSFRAHGALPATFPGLGSPVVGSRGRRFTSSTLA